MASESNCIYARIGAGSGISLRLFAGILFSLVYIGAAVATPAKAAGPSVATAGSMTSPTTAETFKTSCAMCHGVDGLGTALGKALHAPSLQSKEVLDQSDASLARIVATGRNNMPPFGESLDGKQIDGLIQYIRHFHERSPHQK